ncbi:MAG: helix-turn-helix transcriptional regulator [Clostridia bacterium]|nr:helix-turn-helix transcriptional regulator [Clostridia bacterium]
MSNKMGLRIKELREKSGMTQTELAEKLNVSKSLISAYENGIRKPPHTVLQLIAETFGASILSFYEKGYFQSDAVTINISDLKPEQQKIIFSLINEFKKCNQSD